MTASEIENIIIEFFNEKQINIDRNTELFRSGILDSIALIELILYLEKSLKVEVPPTALSVENVETIGKLAQSISDSMQT